MHNPTSSSNEGPALLPVNSCEQLKLRWIVLLSASSQVMGSYFNEKGVHAAGLQLRSSLPCPAKLYNLFVCQFVLCLYTFDSI